METSSSPSSEDQGEQPAALPAPILIAAAILLPPLALFLVAGVSRDFWIAFALTCLGYLPGVAYALFTLLRRPLAPAAA